MIQRKDKLDPYNVNALSISTYSLRDISDHSGRGYAYLWFVLVTVDKFSAFMCIVLWPLTNGVGAQYFDTSRRLLRRSTPTFPVSL